MEARRTRGERTPTRRRRRGLGFPGVGLALLALAAGSRPGMAATQTDLHYGADAQQVLDLILPSGSEAARPLVVYIHGGGFVGGDKHPCLPHLAGALLEQNIAMACVNYRLPPRVTYPTPMLDAARAIQWLRTHAADYRLDPSRVALFGISAGGAISLWIGFHDDLADPSNADPVLRQSTRVSAVVTSNAQATYDPATIAADLHTEHYPKFLVDLFGSGSLAGLTDPRFKAAEVDASPVTHLHAGGPPVLAYYTSDAGPDLAPDSDPQDYIHHPAQGVLLEKAARERGAELTLHAGHDYPDGWPGFLDAAARFLAGIFHV